MVDGDVVFVVAKKLPKWRQKATAILGRTGKRTVHLVSCGERV
jgi:hypothetical protein